MIRCILITNRAGNVLVERFHGVPGDERGPWRAFLWRLGQDNLLTAGTEEEFIACHRSAYIVYTSVMDVFLYTVGSEEYDELGLSEVLRSLIAILKMSCKKMPTEAAILDRYGKVCLALDELVAQGILEVTDPNRVQRLTRMKYPD
eukprot:TRINITY_DN3541_c0_g1_i2.p1 TRINITY_DN3541_c0_g1~~TRINITY_DN3541_c0_g1_i2.p1  ORF type:complete len:146 (+),score=28.00 TRINITY_DN3541_c0_g1_i2:160-597(+)